MYRKTQTRTARVWLTLLFVLVLFLPVVASAHAALLSTSPHEGDIVKTTPDTLKLQFSEPLEPSLIDLSLYDASQRPVAIPKPTVQSGEPDVMYSPLPHLANGTYTAVWSVVSQDGHPVRGSFAFSVGTVSENFTEASGQSGGTALLQNMLIMLRYLVEGLVLLGGGLYWVALRAKRYDLPTFAAVTGRMRKPVWVLLFLGSFGEWFVYSASLPGRGLTGALLSGNWSVIGQSPFAQIVALQLLLLVLLAIPRMESIWYAVIWVLLVAVFAFGGHGWSVEPIWLALTLRALHLLTISTWLGALSYLALSFGCQHRMQQPLDRSAFRPFFVRTVAVASCLVALTGLAMVTIQTDWTKLLNGMVWGKLLIVKIMLMMVMLFIALNQTMRWQREDKLLSFNLVRFELLIGVLVLQAGVWMSQMPYPLPTKTYAQTMHTQAPSNEANTVSVQIPQLRLGRQLMTIRISGPQPQKVSLELEMLDMNMGTATLPTQKVAPDEYQVAVPFDMYGNWKFTVDAEYPDFSHVTWSDSIFIPREGE